MLNHSWYILFYLHIYIYICIYVYVISMICWDWGAWIGLEAIFYGLYHGKSPSKHHLSLFYNFPSVEEANEIHKTNVQRILMNMNRWCVQPFQSSVPSTFGIFFPSNDVRSDRMDESFFQKNDLRSHSKTATNLQTLFRHWPIWTYQKRKLTCFPPCSFFQVDFSLSTGEICLVSRKNSESMFRCPGGRLGSLGYSPQ